VIEVYLNDAKMSYDFAEQHFHNANLWAREHCRSYRGHDVQDVSDVSYYYDNIALYLFEDEQDALMFRLKWS
jgi:hypothetical protein